MHRRDYQLITQVILKTKQSRDANSASCCKESLEGFVRNLMKSLAEDNANFNPHKFVKACGMESAFTVELEDA